MQLQVLHKQTKKLTFPNFSIHFSDERPQASQFSQLSLTLECGRINQSGGLLKPNPYVEISVDGKPPKKTETCKSTYQPKWSEPITLLVTPYSKILFRLYDHSAFKKDSLLGEHTLNLFNVLKQRDGKCQNSTISLEMIAEHKNGFSQNHKVGELVVILDGLNIDMKAVPAATPPVVSVVPSPFLPPSGPEQEKQRRRTAGDQDQQRLPPLAKNQTRGASMSSLTSTPIPTGKTNGIEHVNAFHNQILNKAKLKIL